LIQALRIKFWQDYLNLKEIKWWEKGENYIIRSFTLCALHLILLGDEIKTNKMSKTCNTHWKQEIPTNFGWETARL
jgi:hypothetical protein